MTTFRDLVIRNLPPWGEGTYPDVIPRRAGAFTDDLLARLRDDPETVTLIGRAVHDVFCRGRAPMHSEKHHSAAKLLAELTGAPE